MMGQSANPSDLRIIELVTESGVRLYIRQALPTDASTILDFLSDISPEDLRFRFLDAVRPSRELAQLLTQADEATIENLLAFDASDESLVAIMTIAVEAEPTTAEVALLVRSDLKGRGIGRTLLSHICHLARTRGFQRVECIESSENRNAMRLEEEELGFFRQTHPADATLTVLYKNLGQT